MPGLEGRERGTSRSARELLLDLPVSFLLFFGSGRQADHLTAQLHCYSIHDRSAAWALIVYHRIPLNDVERTSESERESEREMTASTGS